MYITELWCSRLDPQPEYDCGCLNNPCHVVITTLLSTPTPLTRSLLLDNLPSVHALAPIKSSRPAFPLRARHNGGHLLGYVLLYSSSQPFYHWKSFHTTPVSFPLHLLILHNRPFDCGRDILNNRLIASVLYRHNVSILIPLLLQERLGQYAPLGAFHLRRENIAGN